MIINDLLLSSLTKYYSSENNMEQLMLLLRNQNKMSLRLIDWFITNYAKKNNIIYLIREDEDGIRNIDSDEGKIIKQFNVYNSYKSQLKAYSKKQFDPFCRRERINFTCMKETIPTTIGQLNFFKWALTNNIMDYIHKNLESIEDDMNYSLKNIKNNYKKGGTPSGRKPRQELSKSALRGLNKNKMKVSITFD